MPQDAGCVSRLRQRAIRPSSAFRSVQTLWGLDDARRTGEGPSGSLSRPIQMLISPRTLSRARPALTSYRLSGHPSAGSR